MISIDKSVWNLLGDAPHSSIFKIFLYIALNQPEEGVHGFRTTKIQLAVDLNLKQAMIFRSIKWLKDNLLIQELKMAAEVRIGAVAYYQIVFLNKCLQTRNIGGGNTCARVF